MVSETIMTEVIENLGTPKTISIGIEDDQFDEEDGDDYRTNFIGYPCKSKMVSRVG